MTSHPPSGYYAMQYPLPHQFTYQFGLTMDDETKNSTIITILKTTAEAATPEVVEVNPSNPTFAEETGALINRGSIVPKIGVSIAASIPDAARVADAITHVKFNWMPIYISYLNSLTAYHQAATSEVQDILELIGSSATLEETDVLWADVDLLNAGLHPLSTVNDAESVADLGLTTDAKMQSVAFDKKAFFDGVRFQENSGMLKAVTGRMRTVHLWAEKPYQYYSNNFTNPRVKRGNPYTFCGILFHMEQVGSVDQVQSHIATETTGISHANIAIRVQYNEWHNRFEQSEQ